MERNRRQARVDLDRIRNDEGPGPGPFAFWLILAIWPFRDVLDGDSDPRWAAVIALAGCAALYLVVVRAAFDARVPERLVAGLLALEAAVTTGAVAWFEGRWFTLFPMLGIAGGVVVGHLVSRRGEMLLIVTVGGVSALGLLTAVLTDNRDDALATWYGTATAGVVTAVMLRLINVIGALREAREELARKAVDEERLRFSRDLHDLLGHTLSVMVVKAAAVRRVAERDPKLAAEQAADIEEVGRQALGEVRQAVTGYRGRGLAAELEAARLALAEVSIDPVVRRAGPPPGPEADALLGWAVREGVTNVIRHSGARRCEISVQVDGAMAELTIHDDGSGPSDNGGSGNGLRGLTERMAAAAGTVEAGAAQEGGFRLRVALPLDERSARPHRLPGPGTP